MSTSGAISGATAAATSRTDRKRSAILTAARTAFLELGYGATSMDNVAGAAGVSKQTIYKQFQDKSRLFAEVVRLTVEPMHEALYAQVVPSGAARGPGSSAGEGLAAELTAFGRALVAQVLRADVMALRAVIAAEADRFPEISTSWYAEGPARTVRELAAVITQAAADGRCECDDPRRAAEQFMYMAIGDPLLASMFVRPVPRPSTAVLHARVDAAVATFVRAHPPA